MEDDAGRVTHSGADAADVVTEIDAVIAFRAPDRPVVDGEGYGIALTEQHDLEATLHAWPLLGHAELAPREIPFRFGEQDCKLDRENEVTVNNRGSSATECAADLSAGADIIVIVFRFSFEPRSIMSPVSRDHIPILAFKSDCQPPDSGRVVGYCIG